MRGRFWECRIVVESLRGGGISWEGGVDSGSVV